MRFFTLPFGQLLNAARRQNPGPNHPGVFTIGQRAIKENFLTPPIAGPQGNSGASFPPPAEKRGPPLSPPQKRVFLPRGFWGFNWLVFLKGFKGPGRGLG